MENNPELAEPTPTSMDITNLSHVTGMSKESVKDWFAAVKRNTGQIIAGRFEPKTAFDCLLVNRHNDSLYKSISASCPAAVLIVRLTNWKVRNGASYSTYETESDVSTASSTSSSSNGTNGSSSSKDATESSLSTSSDDVSVGSNATPECSTSDDDSVVSAAMTKQLIELLTVNAEKEELEKERLEQKSVGSFSSQQPSLDGTPSKAAMASFASNWLEEGNGTAESTFELLLSENGIYSPLSTDGDDNEDAE